MEIVDEIIPCPKSGGAICYKVQVTPDITNYLSLSCGFFTNSLMKEGTDFYEEQMESALLSTLHKDLAWTDPETGLVWLPHTVNEETKGMVFAMGSNAQDWGWAAVKAIHIPEEERKNHPHPSKKGEFLEWKTDMNTIQMFHENDFVAALDYIGALAE
jgi:hypothetical protein